MINGTADIVKFARSASPLDPWNIRHPAEYVAGASGTLAGLTTVLVNPQKAVTSVVGTGWGSDPAQALGKLVPNVALTLATDGGGAAADAGTAAEDVAVQSAGGAGEFSAADWAAAHDYTTNDGYTTMNGYLRNPDNYTPEDAAAIQARSDRVSAALAKLPAQPGTTYRGVDFPNDVLKNYQEGTVVTEKAFTSTSTDPAVASGTFNGNVLMIVSGKSGRDISGFSDYPEKEILYDKGTQFMITERSWDPLRNKWFIHMEEVGS